MVPENEVRHVADLARLGLTNDEVKKMGEELGVILESVEQIGKLDLSGVPPTANPLNSTNVFRQTSRTCRCSASPGGGALARVRGGGRPVRRAEDRLSCYQDERGAYGSEAREALRASDPVMRRLIDARPGFDPEAWRRYGPSPDPFGTLLRLVIGQQVSTSAARAILERLSTLFGDRLPTPSDLLAAEEG